MCHYSSKNFVEGCSCIDCMEEADYRAEQETGFVHVSEAAAAVVESASEALSFEDEIVLMLLEG